MKNTALRSPWPWLAASALALLGIFVLYPLLYIFTASFVGEGRSGWLQLFDEPRNLAAIGNTLLLACIVTLFSTVIGVPLDAGKIDGRCLDLLSGPESSCR